MTDQEWMACHDPRRMLDYLRYQTSPRKFRLCAIASCSRFPQMMVDDRTRCGLVAAENYCEGRITDKQRAAAEEAVRAVIHTDLGNAVKTASPVHYIALAVRQAARRNRDMSHASYQASAFVESAAENRADERIAQGRELRCIFGNPFRPVAFDPAWRTSTAIVLARGMYESREFSPMPILADALQDAECDSVDILDHCRGPGPHVRGCWVVDLVLGNV